MTEKNEVKGKEKQKEQQKEESNQLISKIKENYKRRNAISCGELDLASEHPGITGSNREDFWMNLFRDIIPQKFAMEKNVIIIDSKENRSNEVDIAVIDNQYTPYVFKYGNLKFIPIEAVAIVVECKSMDWKASSLINWSSNIEKLEASSAGITRIVSGNAIGVTNISQKRTTPIKILASTRPNPQSETIEKIKNHFDFILTYKTTKVENSEEKKHELDYRVPNADKKLGWWSEKLNNHMDKKGETENTKTEDNKVENKPLKIELGFIRDEAERDYVVKKLEKHKKVFGNADFNKEKTDYVIEDTLKSLEIKGNPLLSLNFQLNQLLMLINNPMTFPHFAYAKMFNDAVDEK